jgi:hypothetical protein
MGTTAFAGAGVVLLSGPARVGAAVGVLTEGVAGAVALLLLWATYERGIKGVLAGQVAGFLLRMVFVAAGLLLARAEGGNQLWYCGAFFGLLFAHQATEIAAIVSSAGSSSGRQSCEQPAESKG